MPPDDNDLHRADPGGFDPMKDIRPFQVIPGGASATGQPSGAQGTPPQRPSDSRPEVEITTDEDNLASCKIVLSNGGALVERFVKPASLGAKPSLRFRNASLLL